MYYKIKINFDYIVFFFNRQNMTLNCKKSLHTTNRKMSNFVRISSDED